MYTRKNFGAAPPGYVAGIGRGAIGFTTRSDIGPAQRDNSSVAANTDAPSAVAAQSDLNSYDESQFDKFSGYKQSLFSGIACDRDDITAEKVYNAIDHRMDSRRRARREKLEHELKNITLDVYEQFKEDKKHLGELSIEQWENIPEAGQQTKRPKRQKRAEKMTPVPDMLIHSAHEQAIESVDRSGTITPIAPTPVWSGAATPVNLTQLGHAREKVLDMTLGKLSDSVDGQTVVNPKGYLTDLKSKMISSESDLSDMKKARLLFKSITSSNPSSAPGWVGAARLEEYDGKLSLARKIALKGCDACPDSEDLWAEAARLHPPKNAKAIVARALTFIPKSIKLWIRAEKLETTRDAKRAVLRKALEILPGSVEIWKAAIELENSEDARIMLSKAVRCVPQSVEFWLALARLEEQADARKVLNEARQTLPSEPRIWIAAAKLEEARGSSESVPKIVAKALRSLKAHGVVIDRDYWLRAAYEAEKTDSPITCKSIVSEISLVGIEDNDSYETLRVDAEKATKLDQVVTARALYHTILKLHPTDSLAWTDAVALEKEKGTHESLCTLLYEAVEKCPESEFLWLLLSKEKWQAGEIEESRRLLGKALDINPTSEAICLAAVKLEFEEDNAPVGRALLASARKNIDTARIWMKSALLERELKNYEEEEKILSKATIRFKKHPKLWMMLGQSLEHSGKNGQASLVYSAGLKSCRKSVALWLCLAKAEEKSNLSKARSVLESAKLRIPKSPDLFLASVRLEARNDKSIAERVLARALQKCPDSGILWAYSIDNEIKPKRRGKCHDALKALSENAFVYLSAAKLFWEERKIEKAKNWFERSLKADKNLGDAWAFYYAFIGKHGTSDEQNGVKKRCEEAEPRHGERWIAISKKPGNLKLKTGDILVRVASTIQI